MAYFLRKTKRKNGDVYFQIYDSYYSLPEKKNKNKSARKLGLLSKLKKDGESAPECEERLKKAAAARERERKQAAMEEIGDGPGAVNYGYFLLEGMADYLGAKKGIDLLAFGSRIGFRLSDVLFPLAEARAVDPCSKRKTFAEVFPARFGDPSRKASMGQRYEGLCLLGESCQDVIDILNLAVDKHFGRDRRRVYFDCTNYYFEIDCESGIKRKRPSKENRTDPIVSMALMLDSDLIPYQREVFPGNESEKPHLPRARRKAREDRGSKAKIVQVADKGLNCAENIRGCGKNDGYIFSKSPKMMAEKDLEWRFCADGWTDVRDSDGNLAYRYKAVTDSYPYECKGEDGKAVKFWRAEKRIATFSPSLRKKQCIEIARQYGKASAKSAKARIKEAIGGRNAKRVRVGVADASTGEELEGAEVRVSGDKERLAKDRKLAGYNLLVTSETGMDSREVYRVYHQLWNIERTFRRRKTQLDARPVYVSTDDAIRGHFLTCYTAVLLVRLLEKKVFRGKFTAEEILAYVRKAWAAETGKGEYLNLLKRKDAAIGEYRQKATGLPLMKKGLTAERISSFFKAFRKQGE